MIRSTLILITYWVLVISKIVTVYPARHQTNHSVVNCKEANKMADDKDQGSSGGPSCSFSFKKPLRRGGQQNARKREEAPVNSDSCE